MVWSDVALALTQAAFTNDRFFNLLPFVNRMPRNHFYANLACKVSHGCLSFWTLQQGNRPKSSNAGVLGKGYALNLAVTCRAKDCMHAQH